MPDLGLRSLDRLGLSVQKLILKGNSMYIYCNSLVPSCTKLGLNANSVHPDQRPQKAAFDQGQHFLY